MGVWIEIIRNLQKELEKGVTPLVGVWIEIRRTCGFIIPCIVTPLVGVWIEIGGKETWDAAQNIVTPLVGVWIEIPYWRSPPF